MPHNVKTDEWNPRFVNYARSQGREPQAQLDHDRIAWPGGIMCGFLLWNNDRIGESKKEIPKAWFCGGLTDHALYDKWLTAWVDKHLPPKEIAP